MNTQPEIVIARAIGRVFGPLPEGAIIEGREAVSIFNGFESLLPRCLAEVHEHWKSESLDGFLGMRCCRKGRHAAELIGDCILISDQTVTPVHVRVEISPSADEIVWMECRLGAAGVGDGGMLRIPHSQRRGRPFISVAAGVDSIDWVYRATIGVKGWHTKWD